MTSNSFSFICLPSIRRLTSIATIRDGLKPHSSEGWSACEFSSQALKRAVRTSDVFQNALAGHLGARTQRFGEDIEQHLLNVGATPEKANAIAREVAKVFGKVEEAAEKPAKDEEKGRKPSARTAQLAFIGPEERQLARDLAEMKLADDKIEIKADLILKHADTAADIAMFGRMLADNPDFNREAAVQVAHAVTTHKVAVEDDFYTAVDDLKKPAEDAGAGIYGRTWLRLGRLLYLRMCRCRSPKSESRW